MKLKTFSDLGNSIFYYKFTNLLNSRSSYNVLISKNKKVDS